MSRPFTPMDEGYMLRVIEEALPQIDYPDKDQTWRHAQGLGRSSEGMFPGYKFVPRGGLSSPHVQYVTDLDLIFNKPGRGQVSMGDFEKLQSLTLRSCLKIVSAKVSLNDEELFDDEIVDVREVRRYVESGADLVVLTGLYTLRSGWIVPADFTLQCGNPKMSKESRKAKIRDNVAEENYAKAVQRIRSLLPPQAKAEYAEAWNRMGGALRFLVKQLDIVRALRPNEQRGYMRYLCLPAQPPSEAWAEVATSEMQQRALELLLYYKSSVAPVLGGDASDIYSALEAKGGTSGTCSVPLQDNDGYGNGKGSGSHSADPARGGRGKGKGRKGRGRQF